MAFVVFLDYLVEEDHQRTTLTSQPSWIPINVFIQFVGQKWAKKYFIPKLKCEN